MKYNYSEADVLLQEIKMIKLSLQQQKCPEGDEAVLKLKKLV
jgi:hypothetical protein